LTASRIRRAKNGPESINFAWDAPSSANAGKDRKKKDDKKALFFSINSLKAKYRIIGVRANKRGKITLNTQ